MAKFTYSRTSLEASPIDQNLDDIIHVRTGLHTLWVPVEKIRTIIFISLCLLICIFGCRRLWRSIPIDCTMYLYYVPLAHITFNTKRLYLKQLNLRV